MTEDRGCPQRIHLGVNALQPELPREEEPLVTPSFATTCETSVKPRVSSGLHMLIGKTPAFSPAPRLQVCDLGQSHLHKGEEGGERRWTLDSAFES